MVVLVILEQRELNLCVAENCDQAQVLDLLRDVQFVFLLYFLLQLVYLPGIRCSDSVYLALRLGLTLLRLLFLLEVHRKLKRDLLLQLIK